MSKASLPVRTQERPSDESAGLQWNPMSTAKHDGRPVWLTDGDGHHVEAVWRSTRRVVLGGKAGGKWAEYGKWAIHNAGGQEVPWEPAGWLPMTGAPHP